MEITTVEDLEQRIYRFLHEQLPGAEDLAIEGLHRVGAGLSRENWPFDLHWREGGNNHSLPLILRRDPTGSVLETDRTQEFRVLSALAGEGFPVPTPLALMPDRSGEIRSGSDHSELPAPANAPPAGSAQPSGRSTAKAPPK